MQVTAWKDAGCGVVAPLFCTIAIARLVANYKKNKSTNIAAAVRLLWYNCRY